MSCEDNSDLNSKIFVKIFIIENMNNMPISIFEAGDEPTKKYRIRVQLKISRHLRKIQKIKIGSTRLDSNPLQKILDQLDLVKIQKNKNWIN